MALRVAVVGLGSAATRAHLPALERLRSRGAVEMVGVCDRDQVKRTAIRDRLGDIPGFADNAAMLDAVRPDLLVIATPPSAHLEEIAAAVSRGVHVLCEKPLGLRHEDVATLRALAAAHPTLAIATVHQYVHARAWRWLARATAGAVASAEPFHVRVAVDRPGTDPLACAGWRSDVEHEGGILGDHAVHYLSLLRLIDRSTVVGCTRRGSGGRETATVAIAVGDTGTADIVVSYAGERRRNLIALERPAQCLRVVWDGDTVAIAHGDREGPPRRVGALSDREYVNRLYAPMYDEVIPGLRCAEWRAGQTRHTVEVAASLAAAVGYHRVRGRALPVGARPAAGLR
ncbi:MAG: Gfo/Idh/MocA family protein [Candidatus Dormibacteria bacterium]